MHFFFCYVKNNNTSLGINVNETKIKHYFGYGNAL